MKTILDFIGDLEYIWTRHFHDDRDKLMTLLEQKADFSLRNKNGENILHYAALIGHNSECIDDLITVVRYAMECGCRFTDQDKYGITPLHLEGRELHDLLLNYAIETGETEALNVQDKNGNTPLHWFCSNGRIESWVKSVVNGANPYIKNKNGLFPHEEIAASNIPARGKKQFLKTIEKTLDKLPKPTQAKVTDVAYVKPAWQTPEKANKTLTILGEQVFEIEDLLYQSFFAVNECFAILNTSKFRNIIDLKDGSIKHKVMRYSNNSNEQSLSHRNIWYTAEEDNSNMYIIAVDPQKGFDKKTGISSWQTIIGSSSMQVKSGFASDSRLLALNASSALIVLDAPTGKLIWRAKPGGRTEDTMPILYNDLVYTQCLVKKKPVLCAFNAETGQAVESENIPLTYPMFSSGYKKDERHPIVVNNKLYYFAECVEEAPTKILINGEQHALSTNNYESNIRLVEVDLDKKTNQYSEPLFQTGWFKYSSYKLVAEGTYLHIFINSPEWVGSLNLNTFEFTLDKPYEFFNKSYYTIVGITPDKLYVTYEGKDDYASVEIYSRADGSLLQKVKLSGQTERNTINTLKLIVCSSGILYTYRFFTIKKKVHIELCMIG